MEKRMKEFSEKYSQEEILALLRDDPQAAVAMMIKQYTGLIWKVSTRYLSNPEDIKECVNDTFTEFYCHQDRFDSAKGSLPLFLTTIARNLAISKYRKNKTREASALPDEVPCDTDDIGRAELKFDLDQALSALNPEDGEIIRMRYYDGMTVQEIAQSLHLPYETVKKRQQRSLGKMRMLLISLLLVLLAALLAACAYMVLRYFGIVPGYGINTDPEMPVYTLQEEVTLENENGCIILQDALAMEGTLWLCGTWQFDDAESLQAVTDYIWANIGADECSYKLVYDDTVYIYRSSFSVNEDNTLDFILEEKDGRLSEALAYGQDKQAEITFIWLDMEIPFIMELQSEDSLSSYSYLIGEQGGLMALPHLEQGELNVDIYPLNTGEASILPILIRDNYMQGKTDDITLTSKDGLCVTGEFVYEPIHSEFFSKWSFGQLPPGDYVLHVPYLYISLPMEQITLPIDLTTCQWEDKQYEAGGAVLSVVSCEPLLENIEETLTAARVRFQEDYSYWRIVILIQYEDDQAELEPAGCALDPNCPLVEEIEYSRVLMGSSQQFALEDGYFEFYVYLQGTDFDLTKYTLTSKREIIMRWWHQFDIPLRVEP